MFCEAIHRHRFDVFNFIIHSNILQCTFKILALRQSCMFTLPRKKSDSRFFYFILQDSVNTLKNLSILNPDEGFCSPGLTCTLINWISIVSLREHLHCIWSDYYYTSLKSDCEKDYNSATVPCECGVFLLHRKPPRDALLKTRENLFTCPWQSSWF